MVYLHSDNVVNTPADIKSALLRYLSANTEERYRSLKPAIERLVTDHCDPALTVHLLANEAHMSTTYFRKLFSELFDTTPKKAISCLRLLYAKELLEDSAYSVEAVAGMVGFASSKYFGKLFKKELGLSPSDYKRQQRKRNV